NRGERGSERRRVGCGAGGARNLRAQLTDQIKILDSQVEVKQQQLSDLSEFLRRRGDIEAEYARALDKLTERFTHKTKKKEQWGQSVCQVWSVLLTQTRLESREHAALGDTCCNTLTQRLAHSTEDTHRLHKRSKEVGIQMQDELLKVTTEMQTALKTYNLYHTDCLIAEGKLKEAERLEERHTGKSADSVKKMERLMEKRHGRVQENQLKCTKARNDYLLNLAAANAAMNKYYLQDISTLIDCCDLGFHLSVERVMNYYLASRGRIQKTEEAGLKQLEAAVTSLDPGGDRDALLQQHDAAFCLPFRFSYHPHEGDQVCEVSAESQVRYELETRYQQLQSRLAAVTLETEEVSRIILTSSGQQIPVVVESCIRFINLHGLHHEGIFRVPGSQREVNHIRDAFERGEDPLSDSECDLDSVAGVLKLYFRGLEPPLFPYDSYSKLLECVQIEEVTEKDAQIKAIISTFPRPLLIVMRYLFAFLNHVTQYSDENMMQPYNLAVCFGPSLLRGLDSDDAVAMQPQVNDLVKTMILQHDIIYPSQSELPGPVYEKHMTLEQEYCEPITEEGEGETEHLPKWEAVAMFDYSARSPAELSFKQGELLILHSKASCDWWRGEVGGIKGLIPHKYISVLEGGNKLTKVVLLHGILFCIILSPSSNCSIKKIRSHLISVRLPPYFYTQPHLSVVKLFSKYVSLFCSSLRSERGKREDREGGGSTGNLTADDPQTENPTRYTHTHTLTHTHRPTQLYTATCECIHAQWMWTAQHTHTHTHAHAKTGTLNVAHVHTRANSHGSTERFAKFLSPSRQDAGEQRQRFVAWETERRRGEPQSKAANLSRRATPASVRLTWLREAMHVLYNAR
uniref:Rho GTPase activating protein 4b n=1 Tax=Gasterosteus aculeatus aculeatus TaxID=481459 RepID=G3NJ95_GASAC